MNSNSIMQNVEDLVCRRVNGLMSERCKNGKGVTSDNVYEGKKNIPFVRIVARSFIFDLLHNRFGFSYSVISQRSGMNVTSVMRNVRKCHELVERDKSYQKISEEIDGELVKMELCVKNMFGSDNHVGSNNYMECSVYRIACG